MKLVCGRCSVVVGCMVRMFVFECCCRMSVILLIMLLMLSVVMMKGLLFL